MPLKLNLNSKREISESHQVEISFKHEIFSSTSLIFAGRDTKALVQEYQQRIPLQITVVVCAPLGHFWICVLIGCLKNGAF